MCVCSLGVNVLIVCVCVCVCVYGDACPMATLLMRRRATCFGGSESARLPKGYLKSAQLRNHLSPPPTSER